MSQNANAPFWVRASLVGLLGAAAVPAWMFVAGWALWWLLFHGKAAPPSLFTWWQYFSTYNDVAQVHRPLLISAGAATALVLSPLALFFLKPRQSQHGEARFARMAEIRRSGLLSDKGDGIIVGRIGKQYLLAGKDEYPHVMLAAPTGSGKGVGVVIPNLLHWDHSAIVLDIKKENWQITAGFRQKHGHEVFLFDPASPKRLTSRWNPLAYVSEDPALRVDDIQKIASIIFPDIQGADPIWNSSCRSLFLGIVLYLFETPGKTRTLGQVAREAMSGKDKRFEFILSTAKKAGTPYSPACSNSLLDYVKTSDNTRTSIRKTFTSRFDLFVNPVIDAATSANDFDLSALRKRRMTIYLGITPDNLGRLAPLLNLFFQQVVDLNTRELPEHNSELKYQCLLLLDEFRSLGKVQLIIEAIAFLRGYGLRLLPIFQSPTQISEVHGQDAADTFFDNFNARVVYTPTNQKAADSISRELGTFTYRARSKSTPLGMGKGSRSQSESDQARALLLPQEVKEIGKDEEVILALGTKPILAEKIRWYNDPTFMHLPIAPPTIAAAPDPIADEIDEGEFAPTTVEDVATIYERPLEDFKVDFSDVEILRDDASEEDVAALADAFFGRLSQ